MKNDDIARSIENISLTDAVDLVRLLRERLGIEPLFYRAAPPTPPPVKPPPVQEEFDVELSAVGANKIQVIRVLRDVAGVGLAEARALIDRAPVTILSGVAIDRAHAARDALAAAGATVTVR